MLIPGFVLSWNHDEEWSVFVGCVDILHHGCSHFTISSLLCAYTDSRLVLDSCTRVSLIQFCS